MESYFNNSTNTQINIIVFGSEKSGKNTFIYNFVENSGNPSNILNDLSKENLIKVRYSYKDNIDFTLNFHLCDKTNTLIELCRIHRPFFIFMISNTLDTEMTNFLNENSQEISKIKYLCFIKSIIYSSSDTSTKLIENSDIKDILLEDFKYFEVNFLSFDMKYKEFQNYFEEKILSGIYLYDLPSDKVPLSINFIKRSL